MSRAAFQIESLHDAAVDKWLSDADSDIATVAYVLGIDPHYLAVQVRLHLPFYEPRTIAEREPLSVIREILQRISGRLRKLASIQKVHCDLNGTSLFGDGAYLESSRGRLQVIDACCSEHSVHWSTIPAKFGESIQRDLHYIHSARTDTVLHAGLILSDHLAPFCYASFSDLDREYLANALVKAVDEADLLDSHKVAVMTRAFGYMPAPKNAMSKLFDLSGKELFCRGYSLIITALNPFLGFRGSVFTGSSFMPFATSPMKYKYDSFGNYLTRRRVGSTERSQRMQTPPIVWYVKPLKRSLRRKLEAGPPKMYAISDEEYSRG